MNKILLSILVPTVIGREKEFNNLLHFICTKQEFHNGTLDNDTLSIDGLINDEIEVLSLKDNKEMTIGEKREKLYQMANGLYSIQIDDDDLLSDNAIVLILNAIKSNPEIDCVTFEEYVNMDGVEYKSNHSIEYGDWEGDGQKELWDGFHFHRTPFMKSVIKTEIAKSVPIPHIRFGEDHQWAQVLKPHLKTEIHIPEQIYRYIHNSTPHNERYGFDKDKI